MLQHKYYSDGDTSGLVVEKNLYRLPESDVASILSLTQLSTVIIKCTCQHWLVFGVSADELWLGIFIYFFPVQVQETGLQNDTTGYSSNEKASLSGKQKSFTYSKYEA